MIRRGLSLWEPWASALVDPEAPKTLETRGWSTSYRGEVIILAAQHRLTRRERAELPDEVGAWYDERLAAGELHHGHAVGVATLLDCAPIGGPTSFRTGSAEGDDGDHPDHSVVVRHDGHDWPDVVPPSLILDRPGRAPQDVTADLPWGDYTPGRFAWVWAGVTKFHRSFPAIGHQGLRPTSPALAAAAEAELRITLWA